MDVDVRESDSCVRGSLSSSLVVVVFYVFEYELSSLPFAGTVRLLLNQPTPY
jgi:hypothetical protein